MVARKLLDMFSFAIELWKTMISVAKRMIFLSWRTCLSTTPGRVISKRVEKQHIK